MWLDSASSIDLLFYSPYADTVVKFAKNSELTPLTIGLYGSWGAGKSSLLNMISNKLKGTDTKEKIACVSLNAWQFEGYEDAKIALMESLLKALNENKTFTKKVGEKIKQLIKRIDYIKLGKNAVKKGLPYALGILTGNPLPIALNLSADLAGSDNVVEKISRFKDEYVKPPKDDSEIENIRKFREEFEEMLEDVSEIDNLTVIIDDLDRCTPDRIIDTLEAIKLFLSVKKTTFIIAVDQRIIEYAVKTKYKEIDGYEISSDYIEKIIQLPIKIPELSPKDIENYLLLLVCQLHINSEDFAKLIDTIYSKKLLLEEKAIDFNTIEEIIAELKIDKYRDSIKELRNDAQTIEKIRGAVSSALKGNPRQTKRFLNTFFVRKNLASLYFADELDDSIIAKLLALEIIDIDLFKKLNEWNKSYSGENSQLKRLETFALNPDETIDDELSKWVSKSRVIKWLQSEPNELFKLDLSKYFYLSRESLINSEDLSSSFTEEERRILNRIINCEKGQEDSRIDELQSISPTSKSRIIEVILNKYKSDEIELRIISSLFVKCSEFQNDICDIIKSNTSPIFNLQYVPHFKRMYNANTDLMTVTLNYLEKNKRIDKENIKLILESDSKIAFSVERK